jgi:hypothetical protein
LPCSPTQGSDAWTWHFQAELQRGELACDPVISLALLSPSIVVMIMTVEGVEEVEWTNT